MSNRRGRALRRFRRAEFIERRKPYVETKFDGQLSKSKGGGKKSFRWGGTEKNWKLIYTRGAKCLRARKLGFEYPYCIWRQNQELDLISNGVKP